ncbi:MAG TPA: uroporphyrinogen-III synthase [Verrucomicrobiae bacterium]|nr:uroporphyrinogen-III synthase [Verrucomicrobiae bacterium]
MDKLNQPLAGKRIVVTRAARQAEDLRRSLEHMGAEVLVMPTVCFLAPDAGGALDSAIGGLLRFDWVLFTSQNAVGFFIERCRQLGLDHESFEGPKPRVAAVGPATAQVAAEGGWRVSFVASEHSGEGLARELRVLVQGQKVLLPRSDRSDDRLLNALREAGADVTAAIAYRTARPEAIDGDVLDRIRRGEVDAIVFASPSAFHNLSDSIGAPELARLSAHVQFAAIGPTTARALRQAGLRVEIEAKEPSGAGLSETIGEYYERQASGARHA